MLPPQRFKLAVGKQISESREPVVHAPEVSWVERKLFVWRVFGAYNVGSLLVLVVGGEVVALAGAFGGDGHELSAHSARLAFGSDVGPMALPLGNSSMFEAVELDSAGDVGHTRLVVPAPGEVAGLLRLARAGPPRAVADEEPRVKDLQQEDGQGQVQLVRGEKPP
jgi:hypothetical protein